MCQQRSSVSWWATRASVTDSGCGCGWVWTPPMLTAPRARAGATCVNGAAGKYRRATHNRGGAQALRLGPPPHVVSARRYRLTRRPCGGGCACGRGARAQRQPKQHHPKQNQPNRNRSAASARRGRGHGCRGRSGRPCRRSACDPRLGCRDASRANATRRRKKPNHHAMNARGHHASHHASRRNPNVSRHGLVPRSGERSRPGPRGPRRPGRRACAWRAAGDRSCPPECPSR